MELPVAFRTLVSAHRVLLVICIAIPLLAVGLISAGETTLYTATARVQATNATLGSDTETSSVLNMVRGVATSPNVIHRALRDAGIRGHNPLYIAAHDITLTSLGSSPVIDIGVMDPNPAVARRLAGSLGDEVVTFLRNDSQQQQLQLMSQLRRQQNSLAQQRSRISSELNAAKNPDEVRTLSTALSNVEQQYTQTSGALQQLEVTTAAASSAAVIARPTTATRASSSEVLRLVLAAFGGLVIGLLLAALREMIKPRVVDARNAARQLDAPLLGKVTNESLDALTALSVRRAAERADVTTVAVAGRRDASVAAALTEQFLLRSLSSAANGSPNASQNVSAAAGTNGNGHKLGPSGPGAVAAPPMPKVRLDLGQLAPPTALRAVALSEIAPLDLGEVIGLVVAVSPRMPMASLTRVRDVATATGWPIVGVLDAGN